VTRIPPRASSFAILFVLLLTSCSERDTPDQLRAQLEAIRRGAPATTPPIQIAGDFSPYAYAVAGDENAMTPFGRPTLIPVDAADERPRQRGAKQPLEDVPLNAIRMVGTLSRDGRTDALLKSTGLFIHRASAITWARISASSGASRTVASNWKN